MIASVPRGALPDKHTTRAELDLLAYVPSGRGGGVTTDQVTVFAHDAGTPMRVGHDGNLRLRDGRTPEQALRICRRRGWVIYDKHIDPPVWRRTPTGDKVAVATRGVTLDSAVS